MPPMSLDEAKALVLKNAASYTSHRKANFLLYGPPGSGKTFSTRTAPGPVYVQSFDPGGSRGLLSLAQEHNLIIDQRFEQEDTQKPWVITEWEKDYLAKRAQGFFQHIGTYVIDSLTTFYNCAMLHILAKNGLLKEAPRIQDYGTAKRMVEAMVLSLVNLPCHTICIAHEAVREDELNKAKSRGIAISGSLQDTLPALFDEIYYAVPKRTPRGTEYWFQTSHSGMVFARSRLSGMGKLQDLEPQDFTSICNKLDLPTESKGSFY